MNRSAIKLDEVLESWRNRPLGGIVYLYREACGVVHRPEKVRMDGQIRDADLSNERMLNFLAPGATSRQVE